MLESDAETGSDDDDDDNVSVASGVSDDSISASASYAETSAVGSQTGNAEPYNPPHALIVQPCIVGRCAVCCAEVCYVRWLYRTNIARSTWSIWANGIWVRTLIEVHATQWELSSLSLP